MTGTARSAARGITLLEFAVVAAVVAALAGVLLSRLAMYEHEAERVTAERLVATLRTALQLRAREVFEADGTVGLRRLAEANPFELLHEPPGNYLGEFYSPELERMPYGNWVFDRRDKCLIYLVNSNGSFTLDASKFLKFKVEFNQLPMAASPKTARASTLPVLALVQVQSCAADDTK